MAQIPSNYFIVIAGPTASGKSDYSVELGRHLPIEIINADSAQFYTRLSVGTAKPDWRSEQTPHHLFDSRDRPEHYDVVAYRCDVKNLCEQIWSRGNIPVLVGGSLFYSKTLFFEPQSNLSRTLSHRDQERINLWSPRNLAQMGEDDRKKLWEELYEIDPDRGEKIHWNDVYRVTRALKLFLETGVKPSELTPVLNPIGRGRVLFISPDKNVLFDRIRARTGVMLDEMGWLNEARSVYNDRVWRDFVREKKFIGYPEIFDWIERGEKKEEYHDLVDTIVRSTCRYAKRQLTFWKSFKEQIGDATDIAITDGTPTLDQYIALVKADCGL